MKIIKCYQTKDGTIHTDHDTALRHADKAYGEALHQLSLALENCSYSGRKLALDDNLDLLREVLECKTDTELEQED